MFKFKYDVTRNAYIFKLNRNAEMEVENHNTAVLIEFLLKLITKDQRIVEVYGFSKNALFDIYKTEDEDTVRESIKELWNCSIVIKNTEIYSRIPFIRNVKASENDFDIYINLDIEPYIKSHGFAKLRGWLFNH